MQRFLLFLLLFFSLNVQAQSVKRADSVKRITGLILDSAKVELRKFDNRKIQEYKKNKEFQYEDLKPKSQGFWERIWHAFWKWLDRLFSGSGEKTSSSLWKGVLKYGLMAIFMALIVFVVFKLIGVDFKIFVRKSKEVEVPYDESLENIHEINFDEQIEDALQKANYRLTVRLLYLKTLKFLADRELIDWQPDKTNQAYVRELAETRLEKDFEALTHQFEYIWYGDFNIDRSSFLQIEHAFHQFNQANI